MRVVCLWIPDWETGAAPSEELERRLLELVPRITLDAGRGVVWADVRGLRVERLPEKLHEAVDASRLDGVSPRCHSAAMPPRRSLPAGRLDDLGNGAEEVPITPGVRMRVRVGAAEVPVVAEVAARSGEGPVTVVPAGEGRDFLALRPVSLLAPDPRTLALLEGVGVSRCGELAALDREAVEVRCGPEGVALWLLARADDPRRLFAPLQAEAPSASVEWLEFAVRESGRLVMAVHGLLGQVCGRLRERGERAGEMVLSLDLWNGSVHEERVRCARPTASRTVWLRRMRDLLDRLDLPDAVTGLHLRVDRSGPAGAVQLDAFDPGFAGLGPVEEALGRLVDAGHAVLETPVLDAHPIPERRLHWRELDLEEALMEGREQGAAAQEEGLRLRLLPAPRRIRVEVRPRRDHHIPVRYAERGPWTGIEAALGPQRISGGWTERVEAREYFRCVTDAGRLVWLYRDARADLWYLHGWWE